MPNAVQKLVPTVEGGPWYGAGGTVNAPAVPPPRTATALTVNTDAPNKPINRLRIAALLFESCHVT